MSRYLYDVRRKRERYQRLMNQDVPKARKALVKSIAIALLERHSQREIARMFGISVQALNTFIRLHTEAK